MSKSSYFSGEPIFSQLLSFLPKQKVKSIAEHLSSDRYIKRFANERSAEADLALQKNLYIKKKEERNEKPR